MDKLVEYLIEGIKGIKYKKTLLFFIGIIGIGLFQYSISIKENSEFASTIANNSLFIIAIWFITALLIIAEKGKEGIDANENPYYITSEMKEKIKKQIKSLNFLTLEDDIIHKSSKYDESYSSLGYFKDTKETIYLGITQFINNGKIFKNNKPIESDKIVKDDVVFSFYLWIKDIKGVDNLYKKLDEKLDKEEYLHIKPRNPRTIFIVPINDYNDYEDKNFIKLIGLINSILPQK